MALTRIGRTRLSFAARLFAVNAIVLGVGLLLLEAVFGNWFRPNFMNRLHLIRDKQLTYLVREPYSPVPRSVTYHRDSYGFRGSYPSPSQIDILTIGGSTTDQRNIAEGETWQDVLAAAMAERDKPVTVVNAGVDGQSTVGHVRNFDWWFPSVPGFHPKFVLLYVGINDLYVAGSAAMWEFDDLVDDQSTLSGRAKTTIKERSALYSLFATLRGLYEAHEVFAAYHRTIDFSRVTWATEPLVHDPHALLADQLQAYDHRLKLLLSRIQQLGASPICVTQPAHWFKSIDGRMVGAVDPLKSGADSVGYLSMFRGQRINGLDYYALLTLMNERTRQTCSDDEALTIDLANAIEWQDEDFFDFTHNTPRGTRKVGHYLAAHLEHLF